jgi:hypothetical protein
VLPAAQDDPRLLRLLEQAANLAGEAVIGGE